MQIDDEELSWQGLLLALECRFYQTSAFFCGPGLAAAVCFDFALQYLGNGNRQGKASNRQGRKEQ
jgi:hypothetical protein